MVVHRHGLGRTFHPIWVERFFISWTTVVSFNNRHNSCHRASLEPVSFLFLIAPSSHCLVSNQRSGLTYRFHAIERAEAFPAEFHLSCSQNPVFGFDYRNSVGNYTQLLNTFVLNSTNYFPFDDSRTTLIQTLSTLVSKC